MARKNDEDELIEHWTLIGDELGQVAGKRGPTRLGFALLLKFYTRHGRFPRGRGELPDEAVDYVARQVGVAATELGFYEWDGRTVEYHRAQVRKFLGFRECTVDDAEKLAVWLAEEVCQRERRVERVREELLKHCRDEGIEPPAVGRIGRIIGSGLRQAEKTLVARVSGRIPTDAAARMSALVAEARDDEDDGEETAGEYGRALFAQIRTDPGNISLKTTREEIAKLTAIRAIGLPANVFADIAPKVLAGWRDRAAVEAPSHLRDDHSEETKLTLLAALLHCRQREITDTLVDLLIATVHKINARAERRVVDEFVADLKRVSGKENILFRITEAAVGAPDGVVRDLVFPAAGGVSTLMDLLAEHKTKGNTFRQHKQRVFKASYTNHYRAGLIELIDALEFRSHNTMHRPVLDALELIKRYRVETTHATQYYARGEHVPVDGVIPADLAELLHRADKRGRQRVQRTVYECGVFQTLRERLRCKEIWVVGAEKVAQPGRGPAGGLRGQASRELRRAAQADQRRRLRQRGPRGDARRAGRAARRAAPAGLAGHQGQAQAGRDRAVPVRRRSGAAEPASAEAGGAHPVGRGAAAGHAHRDRAAHRLPGRVHPGRYPECGRSLPATTGMARTTCATPAAGT